MIYACETINIAVLILAQILAGKSVPTEPVPHLNTIESLIGLWRLVGCKTYEEMEESKQVEASWEA